MKVSAMIRAIPGVEPHNRVMHRMHDRLCPSRRGRRWFPGICGSAISLGQRPSDTRSAHRTRHFRSRHRTWSNWAFPCCKSRCVIRSNSRIAPAIDPGAVRAIVCVSASEAARRGPTSNCWATTTTHRFGAMKRSLETMRKAWRGEAVNAGGALSLWPECEGGPPILMGAWRSPRWITFAAQEVRGLDAVEVVIAVGRIWNTA